MATMFCHRCRLRWLPLVRQWVVGALLAFGGPGGCVLLDEQPPQERAPAANPAWEQTLDLPTALALAGAENPTIARAQEAVQASLAERLAARALLTPTLDAGMNFNWHDGNLISSRGVVREVEREALYVGAGAAAVGAGTVGVPGVRVTAHLADALYDPAIADRAVTARQLDAQAVRHNILLEVTVHYYALAGAEARLKALRRSQDDQQEIVRLTANFARAGQGREGDAERARSEALLLQVEEQKAQEDLAVAAAELARVLSIEAGASLRTGQESIELIRLVDPEQPLETLVDIALANRPEVGARSADIAVAEGRWRRERIRPFVPFLTAGFSAGQFGGGSDLADRRFDHFSGRTDVDVLAVWSLQNLGFGNRAMVRREQALIREAEAERARTADKVRDEVTEAVADAATQLRQVATARKRVETAQSSYSADLKRSKNLAGRPLEVLNSLNLLSAARVDLVNATVAYNVAQLRLFVALGQPPMGTEGQPVGQ
jgi:outer membrane protein TolC